MNRLAWIAALAFGLPAGAHAQSPDSDYVIRGVTVISTSDAPDAGVRDVVVHGRRIVQVTRAGSARVAGATVIDGRGKYLIPGLIDSHVHIKEEDPLSLYPVNGVTTVQNMSGAPFHLRMREQTSSGSVLGPRIVTTGPTTAQVGARTIADVEKLVREQQAAGYDAIKMYGGGGEGGMEPDVYLRLVEVAHESGLRVVGHAPRDQPFQTVLDAGQNSIDHMEEIVYTHRPFARLLGPYVDVQFGRATTEVGDSLARLPVPDFAAELRPEIRELAGALRASGLAVTPNLVFFRNIQWMTGDSIHALLREPQLAYAAPGLRLGWSPMLNNFHNGWSGRSELIGRYLERVVELQREMTGAFHEAGVPLMTGTDAEGLGAQPGFGLHVEMELLHRSGLSPRAALRAATIVPAEVLRIADSVGTIESGKIADLVLLDADPLVDIRNTRRIAGVFRAGRWIPREDGQRMLDSLAQSYAPVQDALAEFMEALEREGAVAAMEVHRASARQAMIAKPVERVINTYGYRVMADGRVKEAIEIFRLNTVAFPGEYNTWDSLAEAYLNNGQEDLAIRYYRKVLELRPGDENAARMLRELGETP